MVKPIILWFRSDTRIHDNPALTGAVETGLPVIPIFILDQRLITSRSAETGRLSPLRLDFMYQTLANLEKSLEQLGSSLLFFIGNTCDILEQVYEIAGAQAIFAMHEYASEELEMEDRLSRFAKLQLFHSGMLVPPSLAPFNPKASPFYYTAFKNKVWDIAIAPGLLATPRQIDTARNLPVAISRLSTPVPTAKGVNVVRGGEQAAMERLHSYLASGAVFRYSETRDQLQGDFFTSGLSPWLASGCLSPRLLMNRLNKLKVTGEEELHSVQALMSQLVWRDYFRYLMMRYGKLLFRLKGLRSSPPLMRNSQEAFDQWRNGCTGEPLVDALMRELNVTGLMSNRGRMLVSYFLAKEMKVNWTWGAAWFEYKLLDYDVYCNYGNWAYQAGRGTDSRVNRRFNLVKQAQKFDPGGNFRNRWGKGSAV